MAAMAVPIAIARPLTNQKKKKIMKTKFTGRGFLIQNPMKSDVEANGNSNISFTDSVRTFCQKGLLKEAMHILYTTNQPVNSSAYVCILQECFKRRALSEGKSIHSHITKMGFIPNTFLHNTLVNMYAKCGSLSEARRVFDQMPERDVFSWSVMITAYARHGNALQALALFHQMQRAGIKPNQFTFSSVLSVCAKLKALEEGVDIHLEIIRSGFQSDVSVSNALVDMYSKCGSIEKARDLFDKICQRNVVSWNAMIAGYAQNGRAAEALQLFQKMQHEGVQLDSKSFACVLPACAALASLEQGLEIHEQSRRSGFEIDVFVGSALVDMYVKCGSVEKARDVFDKMPQRNRVSWTAIIAGYAQNGQGVEALKLFKQMRVAGVNPDEKTFAIVLPACASLAALEQGMEIHEEIIRSGFQSNAFVMSALIDMYAKCGNIDKSQYLFDQMQQPDIIAWTAIIAAYSMHGYGNDALKLFEQMQQSGMNPNHVTLVCVLSACGHAGLVDEGIQYFHSMKEYYHLTPEMEHYCCMVDLLGRAGHLGEAEEFINRMPIKPDATVWGCLLASCRIHNNIELGEPVAEHIFELDPRSAAPYVLLSNIYASTGRWDDIENVRKKMKERNVIKMPGCSWIEVKENVHTFLVGDRSHP